MVPNQRIKLRIFRLQGGCIVSNACRAYMAPAFGIEPNSNRLTVCPHTLCVSWNNLVEEVGYDPTFSAPITRSTLEECWGYSSKIGAPTIDSYLGGGK